MSLINQMLMELDARRSEASGTSPFGLQVRAVPERRRMHAAWWVALGLGCLLIVVLGWVLLRPTTIVVSAPTQARLPLRLETDIDSARLSATRSPSVQPEQASMPVLPAATNPDVALPSMEDARSTNESVGAPLAITSTSAAPEARLASVAPAPAVAAVAAPAPSDSAATSVERAPARAVPSWPSKEQPISPQKAIAPSISTQELTDTVPKPIAKQVRELTSQQRAENEFRKATVAIQQGRHGEAITKLEQALQLDAKHGTARQVLIGVLLDMKRLDEAMRLASDGLDLDPRQAGLAMILARLQVEKSALRPAIDTLERSRPYATDRADYMAFLAALLQRDGQHGEAADAYMTALQKMPQNGVWWMGLGISLQAEQRNPEAREAFNRAKSSNSLSPDLLAFVGARLAQLPR